MPSSPDSRTSGFPRHATLPFSLVGMALKAYASSLRGNLAHLGRPVRAAPPLRGHLAGDLASPAARSLTEYSTYRVT